jgi:predicted dehydrogenase
MIRLAVVGIGWAGQHHVEGARELGRKIDVVALMDTDAGWLAEQAATLGIERTYEDYTALLADDGVDAVTLCSPHSLHCAQAVEAARAGKHVLVEKPMALSVSDATRMIEAAEEADVRLYVAESAVYTARCRWLRETVRKGRYVGEVISACQRHGFRAEVFRYPGRREWLTRPELGGTGTWMLHGIHYMAEVRFVLGEVDTVYLGEHHGSAFPTPEIEGTVTGVLTMESGVRCAIYQSCETRLRGSLRGWLLFGDKGAVRASEEGYEVFPPDGSMPATPMLYPDQGLSPFARELEAFADYVTRGVEGPTTARSERRSLAVVEAGYESMRTGEPVRLADRFGVL